MRERKMTYSTRSVSTASPLSSTPSHKTSYWWSSFVSVVHCVMVPIKQHISFRCFLSHKMIYRSFIKLYFFFSFFLFGCAMWHEYSLEGLMLKLKLQYFGHLMWRTDLLGKPLMLGKIEGGRKGDDRGWDDWMASPTQWTWVLVNSRSWWWRGRPGVLQSMGSQRVGHNRTIELNRTE